MFSNMLITRVTPKQVSESGAPWRMTSELETGVSRVLELAVHLSSSAEVAASDAATVAKDATLQHAPQAFSSTFNNVKHRNSLLIKYNYYY